MLNTRGIKIQVKDPVAPQTQDKKTQTPQIDLGRIVEEGGRVVAVQRMWSWSQWGEERWGEGGHSVVTRTMLEAKSNLWKEQEKRK